MNAMRRDAKAGLFNTIVVHKWDRFARNRVESTIVKTLLRAEYGVQIYSVIEQSQDDGLGSDGILMEGFSEILAEWNSLVIGVEISKAMLEKHEQGYHLTRPPFGYDMVNKELIVNEREAEAVRLCYTLYATSDYSWNDLTRIVNEHRYATKTGRKFSKDMVRGILTNRVYIGEVKYQPVKYSDDGKVPPVYRAN